jgi:hypothetical protein
VGCDGGRRAGITFGLHEGACCYDDHCPGQGGKFGHRVICGATQSHRPSAMPRGTVTAIAMIAATVACHATVACQVIVTRLPLGHPIVFSMAGASSPGMDVCICDGGAFAAASLRNAAAGPKVSPMVWPAR